MKWWICDENKRTFLSCKLPKNWNFSKSFKDKIQKSTDGNPLIATPENCNLPKNCNFLLQPNQAYYGPLHVKVNKKKISQQEKISLQELNF